MSEEHKTLTKICSKCKIEKGAKSFYFRKDNQSLTSMCKQCSGIYCKTETTCPMCKKTRIVNRSSKKLNRMCHSCASKTRTKRSPEFMAHICKKGELHHNWSGGRYINSGRGKGYVMVYVPSENPFRYMANKRHPYALEHRLVMAAHLNRPLRTDEHVHHKNGIKTDNRIENLELTSNGQHHKDHSKGYLDGYNKGIVDRRKRDFVWLLSGMVLRGVC